MTTSQYLTIFLFYALHCSLSAQVTRLVPQDYPTIQAGLDAASVGDTVRVASGIYHENVFWDREKYDVTLIGAGSDATVIDGGRAGQVLRTGISNFPDRAISIEGLTVQNGVLEGGVNSDAAGMEIGFLNANLKDIIVRDNELVNTSVVKGVGLYMRNGMVEQCQFINNKQSANAEYTSGAGLYSYLSGALTIENCLFLDNYADSDGGGLNVLNKSSSSTVSIRNSTFQKNVSTQGASIFLNGFFDPFTASVENCKFIENGNATTEKAAGIYVTACDVFISETIMENNRANEGTAIHAGIFGSDDKQHVLEIDRSIIRSNEVFSDDIYRGVIEINHDQVNVTVSNTEVSHNLGKAFVRSFADTTDNTTLINNTFAFNESGIKLGPRSNRYVNNNIIWKSGTLEADTTFAFIPQGETNFDNNLIEGGFDLGFEAENIIDADPLFLDENILMLTSNSPCISTGLPTNQLTKDLQSYQRPLPVHSNPDLGAYEYDEYTSHINVKFYFDENQNGIKESEEKYMSLGTISTSTGKTIHNFREAGIYVRADPGSLKISYIETDGWEISSGADFQIFDVNSDDFSDNLEFGLTPTVIYSYITSTMIAEPFRCSEQVEFKLLLSNEGTVVEDGTLWLAIDERLEDYTFEIDPDIITTDAMAWNFTDLYPYEERTFCFRVKAPSVTSEDELGEIYTFKSWQTVDGNLYDYPFCLDLELRCSFDPNDKLVIPDRPDKLALIDQPLTYTIRFQNTGNDFARNVIVRDTMDPNLDHRTFRLLHTSHPEILEVIFDQPHIAAFHFPNIILPDSLSDESGSNGHITYSIKAKPDIPVESLLENTAHIYFDFNPPIVTNTTQNIMVEMFPVVSVIEKEESLELKALPNPTSGLLKLDKSCDQIRILTNEGRLVIEDKITNEIYMGYLPSGMYILQAEINGKKSVQKIVVSER